MMALIEELFPICRSITGNGVRQTLEILRHFISLQVNEVQLGTAVLDWTVPPEWNIRDAYIASDDGTHVVDFVANNLHIVQYSPPIYAVSRSPSYAHILFAAGQKSLYLDLLRGLKGPLSVAGKVPVSS